jgi:hypothetical protein
VQQDIQSILMLTKLILALLVALNVLVLIVVVVLYRCGARRLEDEVSALAEKVGESIEAGVKILAVRQFYEETYAEYQRMLNEAHRDGDRRQQDRLRRLIETLATLKARVVDRTSRLLEDDGERTIHRRRRRRRPRRPHNGGPAAGPSGPQSPPSGDDNSK